MPNGKPVHLPKIILALCLVIFALGMSATQQVARAEDGPPPGPDRYTGRVEQYTAYLWWLTDWDGNEVVCQLVVDHEGLPTANEIYRSCTEKVYTAWSNTKTCAEAPCIGYYLHLLRSAPAERIVPVILPPPTVEITLTDCALDPYGRCLTPPTLVMTGIEPVEGYQVIRIAGTVDGAPFTCESDVCAFALLPTAEQGAYVEFWAYSSYGDSSKPMNARVRVVEEWRDDSPGWYVDVLSAQWVGNPAPTCALSWQTFPPTAGLPRWLTTPETPADLQTELPYYYLAGELIRRGVVDADACPDKGLLANGNASECGLKVAQPEVTLWQNQFDDLIFATAQGVRMPAFLLKNMFSRESQFWPSQFVGERGVGLGQLTEKGADTTLLWNPAFYSAFCPLVLGQTRCDLPYSMLEASEQRMLQGALVTRVDATCPTCPLGIDLQEARDSVSIFGEALRAHCVQTGQLIRNVYGQPPGELTSYENMWRFTLVSYNAGIGCLSESVNSVRLQGLALDWFNVSNNLMGVCRNAINYANDMSR